jgi:hypothetical protein
VKVSPLVVIVCCPACCGLDRYFRRAFDKASPKPPHLRRLPRPRDLHEDPKDFRNYVGSDTRPIEKAIEGMLSELDPHSQYLAGLEYEDLMVSTRGEFGGLGILISFRDNFPTVMSPIDGTPAERAGIRGGDQSPRSKARHRRLGGIGGRLLRGEPTKAAFRSRPDRRRHRICARARSHQRLPFLIQQDERILHPRVELRQKTARIWKTPWTAGNKACGLVMDFRRTRAGSGSHRSHRTFLIRTSLVYTKGRLANANRIIVQPTSKAGSGRDGERNSASAGDFRWRWRQGVIGRPDVFGGNGRPFTLSETEAVLPPRRLHASGRSIHKDERTRRKRSGGGERRRRRDGR